MVASLAALEVPRILDCLPLGGDEEVGAGPQVYLDGLLALGKRLGFDLPNEDDVPVISFPLDVVILSFPSRDGGR